MTTFRMLFYLDFPYRMFVCKDFFSLCGQSRMMINVYFDEFSLDASDVQLTRLTSVHRNGTTIINISSSNFIGIVIEVLFTQEYAKRHEISIE